MSLFRALAVMVAVMALAACGGGGASSSATDHEFVAQANAICARAEKKAVSLVGSNGKLTVQSLGRAVALLEQTAAELSRVQPPSSMQASYARYLALARHEVALTAKLSDYIHTHNVAGVRSLEGQLNSTASNEAARALGLNTCAREVA